MNKNISAKISKGLDDYKKTIWVYKKSTNAVSSNYDPYRETGYINSFQSPLPLKAIVHQISGSGLIFKELGLSLTGAVEIIVKDNEAEIIKNASKLKIDNSYYTLYNERTGSRVLITQLPFGMKKIVCFVKGNS